ncbi:MAG: 4Fe-4S dicluster domain-containing protein [Gammaproteobacteria bacterium]|nr:4Fe-4S dicluster domain-containing protein [Gammaproteobacteria bacterium]
MGAIDEQPNISKRGLLTGAFLTREGRKEVLVRQKPLGPLPPPWYGTPPELCGSCEQQCVEACPQAIIKLHQADHSMVGIPYLDFASAGCTFCGECADKCPSDAERRELPASIGSIHVDRQKCLPWNGVFCMSCIGRCDFGVLQLDERRQLISEGADCCGCGMCVHACPVNALEVQP